MLSSPSESRYSQPIQDTKYYVRCIVEQLPNKYRARNQDITYISPEDDDTQVIMNEKLEQYSKPLPDPRSVIQSTCFQ